MSRSQTSNEKGRLWVSFDSAAQPIYESLIERGADFDNADLSSLQTKIHEISGYTSKARPCIIMHVPKKDIGCRNPQAWICLMATFNSLEEGSVVEGYPFPYLIAPFTDFCPSGAACEPESRVILVNYRSRRPLTRRWKPNTRLDKQEQVILDKRLVAAKLEFQLKVDSADAIVHWQAQFEVCPRVFILMDQS